MCVKVLLATIRTVYIPSGITFLILHEMKMISHDDVNENVKIHWEITKLIFSDHLCFCVLPGCSEFTRLVLQLQGQPEHLYMASHRTATELGEKVSKVWGLGNEPHKDIEWKEQFLRLSPCALSAISPRHSPPRIEKKCPDPTLLPQEFQSFVL